MTPTFSALSEGGQGPWVVVLRDGVPANWRRAAEAVLATLSSLTAGDANRAVRFGYGFIALPLVEAQALDVARALTDAGIEARAVQRADLEQPGPVIHCKTLSFDAPEAAPGCAWERFHFIHVARIRPAPFFAAQSKPPESDTLKWAQVALDLAGEDGAASVVGLARQAAGISGLTAAPTSSNPELMVELLGLWAPRVQLPVDTFSFQCVPSLVGVTVGRRVRLTRLLEAICARVPEAMHKGLVKQALDGQNLDAVEPVDASAHRTVLSAWLTAERIWANRAQ